MSVLSLHVKRPITGVDGETARTAHSHQHAEIKKALVPVFPDLGQTRDIICSSISNQISLNLFLASFFRYALLVSCFMEKQRIFLKLMPRYVDKRFGCVRSAMTRRIPFRSANPHSALPLFCSLRSAPWLQTASGYHCRSFCYLTFFLFKLHDLGFGLTLS